MVFNKQHIIVAESRKKKASNFYRCCQCMFVHMCKYVVLENASI